MTRLAIAVAAVAAVAVAVAACQAPPLSIELQVKGGAGETCPTKTPSDPQCSDVPIACDSMLLVRILDPANPDQPYVDSCQRVSPDRDHDLCAIASIDLGSNLPSSLPERTLDVQVVVMPLALDASGDPDCDAIGSDLQFSLVTGTPIDVAGTAPIGGHAYYHPGDATTVVELGCSDLSVLNLPSCVGADHIAIGAVVDELDTEVDVSSDTADTLAVSIGEPQPLGAGYVLEPSDTTSLARTSESPPAWGGSVGSAFVNAACLDVLDDSAESTATLRCTNAVAGVTSLELDGVHISRDQLAQFVAAISAVDATFTLDDGLVVGIVVDDLREPVPDVVVSPVTPGATVRYLTADGSAATGSATSINGIFLSTDAPFNTTWTVLDRFAFGGLVEGKVTVVVLQASETAP